MLINRCFHENQTKYANTNSVSRRLSTSMLNLLVDKASAEIWRGFVAYKQQLGSQVRGREKNDEWM